MSSLDGKVFLVTGATGAVAAHIVHALHAAGARLALADLHEEALIARAQPIGGAAIPADLTDEASARAMVDACVDVLGRVDGLVHTVGGFTFGPAHEATVEDYERMFRLNVRTLFLATRAVLPRFRAQGSGFLAGIASGQAWRGGDADVALYAAAKSAVAAYLTSVDLEQRGSDVRVSIVYPMGVVDTPANRRAMPDADPADWIDPVALGEAVAFAAAAPPSAHVRDLPVYPR